MAFPKKPSLAESLLDLLPGSEIINSKQTEWHSATFIGLCFDIDITLSGINAAERIDSFQAMLPEYEFDLRRYVVADILVKDITRYSDRVTFHVEALLLDE
jgi:hypothetical protein